VVPDRIVLSRAGFLRKIDAGRKNHRETCAMAPAPLRKPCRASGQRACLDAAQAVTLGRMLRKCEAVVGRPARSNGRSTTRASVLQAPAHGRADHGSDEIWLQHPGLNGHPAGIGWGAGRAVVVSCECELSRVAPGDVLVTRVAGPALVHILPRVAGVVAELGGSTSHLASLARERGIPMVLGVLDATRRIPDGAQVAVDGVAGIVRWIA
jgi:pyruvate,water dikinase